MASRHAHICGSLGYGPEGSPHGSVIASSRLLPRTHVFMTHCHVTQGYQMSTSTLMHPTLVPGRDLPHLMLAMPHQYLFHASEAVRCTHSLGPAPYPLPTPYRHTPCCRYYHTFRCDHQHSRNRSWTPAVLLVYCNDLLYILAARVPHRTCVCESVKKS